MKRLDFLQVVALILACECVLVGLFLLWKALVGLFLLWRAL